MCTQIQFYERCQGCCACLLVHCLVFFTVGLDGGVQPLDSGVFFKVEHEVTSEPAGSLHPVLNSVILSLEVVDEGVLTNRFHFQESPFRPLTK